MERTPKTYKTLCAEHEDNPDVRALYRGKVSRDNVEVTHALVETGEGLDEISRDNDFSFFSQYNFIWFDLMSPCDPRFVDIVVNAIRHTNQERLLVCFTFAMGRTKNLIEDPMQYITTAIPKKMKSWPFYSTRYRSQNSNPMFVGCLGVVNVK
jgi:hypothetical protein